MSDPRPISTSAPVVACVLGRIPNDHAGTEIRVEEVQADNGHVDVQIRKTRQGRSDVAIVVPGVVVHELLLYLESYLTRRRRRLRDSAGVAAECPAGRRGGR